MPSLPLLGLLPAAIASGHAVRLMDLDAPATGIETATRTALLDAGLPADADRLHAAPLAPWRGRQRLSLTQHLGAVPVLGAGLIAQQEPDGRLALVQGRLASVTVDPVPTVSPREARRSLDARLPDAASTVPHGLAILPDGQGGRLVWVFRVRRSPVGPPWRVLVDAHDGVVRVAAPVTADALGRVFLDRAEPGSLAEVLLPGLPPSSPDLDGSIVQVRSRVWEDGEPAEARLATANEDGDFRFEPDPTDAADPFSEVNAYWHGHEAHRFFAEEHAHPVPDRVDMLVNETGSEGGAYDNAYFTYGEDGRYTLTFGQGAEMDWSHDPSVIVHELAHGIVNDQTGMFDVISYPVHMDEYGLHPAPGGLTEGLPDYWATTRTGHSALALLPDGTPIRDVDNSASIPSSVLGEAHQDGLVVGGVTWDIREALGAEATDAIVYGATGLIGATPTYADFGAALVVSAEALHADQEITDEELSFVEAAVAGRGIADAGRSVPLDASAPPTLLWPGADLFDPSFCTLMRGLDVRLTPTFQLALTVPEPPEGEEIDGVDLAVDLSPVGPGALVPDDLQYMLVGSRDGLVRFEVAPVELLGSTWSLPRDPLDAAWRIEGEPSTARLSVLGAEPWSAGDVIHVTLTGTNCRTTTVQVRPEWSTRPAETSSQDPAPEADGCARKTSASMFLLPLLAVPARRRRNRWSR